MKTHYIPGLSRSFLVPALLVSALILRSVPVVYASDVSFDGDGTSSIALGTANNWSANVLPTTSDQAIFTDADFGGALPASLTNSVAQTWGNLVWNSASTTVLSGSKITLSGGGGNASNDLITVGSNMTSGSLTWGFTSSGSFINATTGNINVVNAGATLNFSTQFEFNSTVTNQVITKTGAGTLNFSNGNNGNLGAGSGSKFVLDGGTLNFSNGNGNMFGGSTSTILEIHNGTFLDTAGVSFDIVSAKNYAQTWAGDFTFKGTTKSLNMGTGAVTITGGSRQITVNALTFAVGGVIGDGGNAYGLTKAGASTLQLYGASTYTGSTTVNAGTLQLAFSAATAPTSDIVSSSSALNLGGGTLLLTGKASTVNSQTFNGVTIKSGASQFTSTIGTSGTVNSVLGTVSRNAGGTLNITLPATGTVSVSNSNDANGLLLAGVTVGNNDWATVSAGTIAAFTGYTAQNAVGSWTANQNITTTAALSGSLGSSLTINSLRLNFNTNASQNIGSNTLTVLDGILLTGTAGSAQTITGGSIQGSAGGDLVVINNGGGSSVLTIGSNIINNTSATAFTKSGSRKVTLSGASNTYTGATYVNAGTLAAGVATTAFGNNSAVVISTGATLDITGFSQTVGSLASNNATSGGTGAVTLGAATLTTGGNNTSTTFAGVISGTGSLVKTGTGTQTLSGINTYTGTTTVGGGTLALGAANRIADTSNLVMTGGTFATGGFSETLGTLTLSAASTIDLGSGASALVFADSSATTWTSSIILSFINFTAGTDAIRIGTTNGGLTSGQLAQITLNGSAATIDSGGFLAIAIPEPSTYAAIFGAFALGIVVWCRRRRRA